MPDLLVVLLLATPLLSALACAMPGFEQEAGPLSAASAALLLSFSLLLAARATGLPDAQAGVAASTLGAGPLAVDCLSVLVLLCVSAMGAAALLSVRSLEPPAQRPYRYRATALSYIAIHLLIAALMLTVMASNLALLWVGLTSTTLLALLLARDGDGQPWLPAPRREHLCLAGLALALSAIVLLALSAAPRLGYTAAALDWPSLQRLAAQSGATHRPFLARPAFALAILGFGALCALVAPPPWLPDLRSRFPSAQALLQFGLPLGALYALLRCQAVLAAAADPLIPHFLLAAALLALVPIVHAVILERSLPRLLGHACGAQIALIAAAFGQGDALGAEAGALLLFCYTLTAGAALPAANAVCRSLHTQAILRTGAGLRTHPVQAALVLCGLLSLGGLPPTGGFVALGAALDDALRRQPQVGAALVAGWAAVCIALATQAGRMAYAAARFPGSAQTAGQAARLWPLLLPVAASVMLSFYVPEGLARLCAQAGLIVAGGR